MLLHMKRGEIIREDLDEESLVLFDLLSKLDMQFKEIEMIK